MSLGTIYVWPCPSCGEDTGSDIDAPCLCVNCDGYCDICGKDMP